MKPGREFFRGISEYRASAIALVAANVVPLFGVLFLGWDAFAIVALYWIENVVIGAINVLKMIACSPDPTAVAASKLITAEQLAQFQETWKEHGSDKTAALGHHAAKLFFIPFFTFHYGMFCMGHGAFVFFFFGRDLRPGPFVDEFGQMFHAVLDAQLGWAAAALAGSHLYSFLRNYLGRGEFRRTFVTLLMFQPYGRIVVLHIAIIIGAFIAMALGSNVGVLIMLIVGKTALDLSLHLWERRINANGEPATARVEDQARATRPVAGR